MIAERWQRPPRQAIPVGPIELLLVLAIVVLIFGVVKLSGVGGALGKSIRDFRAALRERGKADYSPSPESDPTASASRCGQCGSSVSTSTKYCSECGEHLQVSRR